MVGFDQVTELVVEHHLEATWVKVHEAERNGYGAGLGVAAAPAAPYRLDADSRSVSSHDLLAVGEKGRYSLGELFSQPVLKRAVSPGDGLLIIARVALADVYEELVSKALESGFGGLTSLTVGDDSDHAVLPPEPETVSLKAGDNHDGGLSAHLGQVLLDPRAFAFDKGHYGRAGRSRGSAHMYRAIWANAQVDVAYALAGEVDRERSDDNGLFQWCLSVC